MKLFGFTLIRRGVTYDYPFQESLKSMAPLVEKIYIAVGESGDGTEEAVANLPKTHSIPTVWDDNLREGGIILSQQTNIALEELRKDHGSQESSWGIYLQGDEVLHENDYQRIIEDLKRADQGGYDCMRFRYVHFWQSHNEFAINKKWYPQEIRAVKLNSKIESWGDAQSFRNFEKPYESDAHIYHYGHVRDASKYQLKKHDFLLLYHREDKLKKYRTREKRFDDMTETLPFFGSHPSLMFERIKRIGGIWSLPEREKVVIVGNSDDYDQGFLKHIHAKKVEWVSSVGQAKKSQTPFVVFTRPNLWQKLFWENRVPLKMRSKLSRPWTPEFRLAIALFKKGVGIKWPLQVD